VLTHPTFDQLGQLGLSGMAQAFCGTRSVRRSGEAAALTHADWLDLLLDRELTHRRDKRLAARLRYARLRQQAAVEDVDYRAARAKSPARGLSANENVCALISMEARSTAGSNLRPDPLIQDRKTDRSTEAC
jgi:hypothetical protein